MQNKCPFTVMFFNTKGFISSLNLCVKEKCKCNRSPSEWTRARLRADARPHPRGPIRVRAYTTPIYVHYFCSFSPLPLVEVVGFVLQCPFWLAKGEGVTSIMRGIFLRLKKIKNTRVVCTFLMLAYSVV
jgi:hypothetical protein